MKKLVISSLVALTFLGTASAAEYAMDKAHSSVGFKIKHMSISNVSGKFNDFSTVIDADKGVLNKLEATIKTASVDTENQTRDDHLRTPEFFNSEKNPDMTFKMTKFSKEDGNEGDVYGELTINGVTKPVKLDYEFGGSASNKDNKEIIGFSLEGKIKRSDFGFAPSFGNMMLGDEIKINIDIEAVAK